MEALRLGKALHLEVLLDFSETARKLKNDSC